MTVQSSGRTKPGILVQKTLRQRPTTANWSSVDHQLSAGGGQPSAIDSQTPAVDSQTPAVGSQTPAVGSPSLAAVQDVPWVPCAVGENPWGGRAFNFGGGGRTDTALWLDPLPRKKKLN